MTRKKVKLAWIVNDRARRASLRKRKQGLVKKVRELTVLCGVDAFIVIFSSDDESPVVWSSVQEVETLLQRFNEAPEMEKSKKRTTQESYLEERVEKVEQHLRKQVKKNQELVADQIMFRISQGTQLCELENDDLATLFWMAREKINETQKKIEYFQQVPLFAPPPLPIDENRTGEQVKLTENRLTEMDHWFINIMMKNKDVPGSSRASVYGALDYGGSLVNGGCQIGFPDCAGFEFDWPDTTLQYPNGGEQMNEVGLYLPEENLVNEGVGSEAAIKESGALAGNNQETTIELYNPDNMDFVMGNEGEESTDFLQDFFDGINDNGNDPALNFDFNNPWDDIFSP